MLLRPAVVSLLLASSANVAMLLACAPFAIEVIRRWDIASGSERQLILERRTYLVSALLTMVLAAQLIALLLFVLNADRMSAVFVGAMCAAGTLNVNAFGFPALIAQIAVFFLAALWLAINHVDVQAPDYPLVRIKYALLLAMAPVVIAAFYLELRYFLGLEPDVLTSCCARLFTGESPGLPGDLVSLPPGPATIAFYGALAAAVVAGVRAAILRRGGYALALTSLVAFGASIAGIVSFLSLYVYEHPNHHCPFCVLKAEYGYQGYLLYVPLFAATACGLSTGALQLFAPLPGLRKIVPRTLRRLAATAAAGFALLAAVATVMILRSNLVLNEAVQSLLQGVKP
jgi:hypothetical protein